MIEDNVTSDRLRLVKKEQAEKATPAVVESTGANENGYIHIHIHMSICAYDMYMCVCMYMYVCMYVCMCIHLYVYGCPLAPIPICMYV
jgi:hypothetical protein